VAIGYASKNGFPRDAHRSRREGNIAAEEAAFGGTIEAAKVRIRAMRKEDVGRLPGASSGGSYGPLEERIVGSFQVWAEKHPQPSEVIFMTLDGELITPRSLADGVARHSLTGADQVAAFKDLAALEGVDLEEILDIMVMSVSEPA